MSTKSKPKPKAPKVPVKAKAKPKKKASYKAAVKAAVKTVAKAVQKKKPAAKPATKKRADDGGRLVNVKMWPNEKKTIVAKAKQYTGGNVSSWLRFAAVTCVPSKAQQAELKAGDY